MRLEKIKYTQCPTCSAKIKDARIHNQHSSGEWNETITFDCGAVHNYSPNFCRILINDTCPKERKLIHINFLLKATLECDPGVVLETLQVRDDDLGWYWNQQFEIPKGCRTIRAKIIKQVKTKEEMRSI